MIADIPPHLRALIVAFAQASDHTLPHGAHAQARYNDLCAGILTFARECVEADRVGRHQQATA